MGGSCSEEELTAKHAKRAKTVVSPDSALGGLFCAPLAREVPHFHRRLRDPRPLGVLGVLGGEILSF
jgi:hypothetical protein